jgi:hypothetical protein
MLSLARQSPATKLIPLPVALPSVSHLIIPAEVDELEENMSFRMFTEVERSHWLALFLLRDFPSAFTDRVSQLLDMLLELFTALNDLLARQRRPGVLIVIGAFPFRSFYFCIGHARI